MSLSLKFMFSIMRSTAELTNVRKKRVIIITLASPDLVEMCRL
jgi:hypothetical protein